MPDPARPLSRALRPDPPVVCPGFGFDSTGIKYCNYLDYYFEISVNEFYEFYFKRLEQSALLVPLINR